MPARFDVLKPPANGWFRALDLRGQATRKSYVDGMSTTDLTSTNQASQSRTTSGQFIPDQGFHAVMDAVARVARAAAVGDDPHTIGRRRFNAARADVDASVPTAQALVKRFGRPLHSLIDLALTETNERGIRLGPDHESRAHRDLPPELIFKALRACVVATGQVPLAYDWDAWAKAENHRRERAGLTPLPLPHSKFILDRFGGWGAALVAAGVIEDAATLPTPHTWNRKTARPAAESISECIDATGILPTRRWFIEWCQRMDIPVGGDLQPWGEAVAACRELRRAAGKTTPATATRPKDAPPMPDQVTSDAPRRRTFGTRWTREECIAALARYGQEYLKGKPATQRHYRACAKGDPDLPSPSTLQKHGLFQDLCTEAGL